MNTLKHSGAAIALFFGVSMVYIYRNTGMIVADVDPLGLVQAASAG